MGGGGTACCGFVENTPGSRVGPWSAASQTSQQRRPHNIILPLPLLRPADISVRFWSPYTIYRPRAGDFWGVLSKNLAYKIKTYLTGSCQIQTSVGCCVYYTLRVSFTKTTRILFSGDSLANARLVAVCQGCGPAIHNKSTESARFVPPARHTGRDFILQTRLYTIYYSLVEPVRVLVCKQYRLVVYKTGVLLVVLSLALVFSFLVLEPSLTPSICPSPVESMNTVTQRVL